MRWTNKEEFKACVYDWAKKLNVTINHLSLRPMTNKWASCSTNGNLNFNLELLNLDRDLGEYVIVHELLHFSVPNHGKLWKVLMEGYSGDYQVLEERLRKINAHSEL
jgi:predicted metal-dependent hydrolase